MKLKHIPFLAVLFAALFTFSACSKKDRSPTLKVIVYDSNENLIKGANVHVWPTDEVEVDSTSSGVPNLLYDKEKITDGNGVAEFSFPSSAVLDVDVTYTASTSDTTTALLTGHKVVKIETVRQKDENNIFEEKIYIK